MASSSGNNNLLASSSLARQKKKGADGPGAGGAGRGPAGGGTGGGRKGRQGASASKRKPGAKVLWAHDLAVAWGQLLPIALIAVAAFMVLMPVSTAAIPDTSVFNLDYTHDQMKFRFWAEDLNLVVCLGACAYGLVLGIAAFRFMLVKRQATAVLSLPLTRTALFATRFGACLLAAVAGLALPLAVSLAVNVAALGVWEGVFAQALYVFCGLFLTAAFACAVAACACALSGTLAEAVSFSVALLSLVTVCAWGLNAVMGSMLVGNAFGAVLYSTTEYIAPTLLQLSLPFNPALFFLDEAAAHQVFIVQHPVYVPEGGNLVLLGGWAVACVAAAALALALVNRRKGEKAAIAGLSLAVPAMVGLAVGFAAFGAVFTLLAEVNVGAAIVGALATFALVSVVLYLWPLRPAGQFRWGRTAAIVGGQGLVLLAVLAGVGTGGLGYASFVPNAADVVSATVSYTGTPTYLARGFDSAKTSEGAYYFSTDYSYTDEESIRVICDVHAALIQSGSAPLGEDRFDFSESVMPYDVVVAYTLTDGSRAVRYYDRATLGQLYQLAQLDQAQVSRERTFAAVTGDASDLSDEDAQLLTGSIARQAFAMGDIYVSDRLYSSLVLVNCDAQARLELLDAIGKDVAAQSIENRYHPQSPCVGVLMFTQAGDSAAKSFAYQLENTLVYLTEEFANTLAWCQEKGIDPYLTLDGLSGDDLAEAELVAVKQITVQHYAPFSGMNAVTEPTSAYFLGYKSEVDAMFIAQQDWGTRYSTDDEAEVAELLSLARNTLYLDQGAYLLSIELEGGGFSYLAIDASAAPEWLVRVAA
ncbi:MAG: hypothetical protein HFJ66_03810 [Eggerthellaceae bacterium]|nr:hypothetical protein [Eggerthellaceae bacterium]